FIKLFPQDEETPAMLSKAGALYYQRHDFKHALRYFKTLTKHFPQSDQALYARFITMESYFGKGDYKSAEIVADRLRGQNSEYAERANQRLAQAIFLQAKTFADSLDHLRAAREFQRMVATTPDAEFADLALFNAAQEYDKLPDYTQAIAVYQQLLAQHPQSEYRLSALNNLAFDYHEIGDFEDAAVTYRELADSTPDSSQAVTALYNASVSYVEAENWRQAIAVNNAFADRFPNADEADDLLFDNAKYYLKLQDLESANAIYARFAEKFPDSPRVVEAHYLRGEYFRSQNRLAEARAEYEKALASSESLHTSGREFDDYFTAEALFQLTELTFAEYKAIRFTLPEPALSEKKKQKKDLLLQLVNNYTKVAAFGTPRLYEATYRIGNSYEEFADAWANQEIATTDENARIVARKEISETTAGLYREAVDAYKKGVEVLRRFAQPDSTAPADTSRTGAPARLSASDSTEMRPEHWIAKCEEKISEDLFKMAETGHRTLDDLLSAQVPAGMSKLEQLVYQQQLLKKAIFPTVEKVLQAHANNLSESAALNLENRWVDSSRTRVAFLAKLVPEKLAGLADAALEFYAQRLDEYVSLVEKDDDAAFDLGAELSNLVSLATDLALNSAAAYKKAVERVRALQLSDEQITDAEAEMMQRLSEFAIREDSLAVAAETKRNAYDQRFKETDAANYEDAFYTLDDLDLSLSDGRTKILKAGFEMVREFQLSNTGSQAIVLALLREQPEEYAAQLDIELDTEVFPSSSDWRASATQEPGWTDVSFSDSLWSPAYREGAATAIADTLASAVWLTEIDPTFAAGLDSSQQATTISSESPLQTDDLSRAIRRPDKVYFRREFAVSGIPISGRVLLAVDDSSRVYCNGRFVAEFAAPKGGKPAAHTLNIARFLEQRQNIVAIEATDRDRSRGSLEAVVQVWRLQDLEQLRKVLSGERPDAAGEEHGQDHMDSNEE
ncbi:MAG: outer membrane protein assembly factor BamD, partial [Calditrichaeota bacterium]